MRRFSFLFILLMFTGLLVACGQDPTTPIETTTEPIEQSIQSISGLDDVSITQFDHFHPLNGVEVINEQNVDISHLFEITGYVDYGTIGSYTLTYDLVYGDETIQETREVTVVSGSISRPLPSRSTLTGTQIARQLGTYRINQAVDIAHPPTPRNIDGHLLTSAVPSNGWWTSLLVANYGGGNGIYTNPLRSSFSNFGAEITNPGAGFVQYWNPDGFNTMANFSLALPDLYLKTTTLNDGYETHVTDYSDTTVSVAMRNVGDPKDHMVLTYAQGSPYVFAEVANRLTPYVSLATQGASAIEFYDLDGSRIEGQALFGEGIIVKYVQKHIGYETYRPAQVGQPIYGDRFMLISTPEMTTFNLSPNRIAMTLGDGNYFSVAAIQSLDDATYFHQHAHIKTIKGDVSYTVDHHASTVETTYHVATQNLDNNAIAKPIQYLLPHHYIASDATLTNHTFETVRGILKLMEGATFQTTLSFHGLLPAMSLPTNTGFNTTQMATYLADLDMRTQISDTSNFLNDEGPYWNSKAIYPLAQGIIIADQIGDEAMKVSLIAKMRYLLTDWYTYSTSGDDRYLYYNEQWGSVYYSNNDFNTASELSDHAFTHGYLIYASSVLAMYDDTFVEGYGEMVDLLLSDYMHPIKDDHSFAYLRSFDPWAGHTWAHGFGTFAEGNNIESSSEAIQSWVGGYLWALQNGDTALRDAAIYGFVHELNSAKIYMFDYEDMVFKDNYAEHASVAGMIWGGKYDYATWFGANPTFIYGIQWLPNGEYLSNYALNDEEFARLSDIYTDYLSAKNNTIDTWFANMWSIQALLNPDTALAQFDAQKILTDDYPSDLSQTYYLLHGLKTYGRRTTSYVMRIHQYVSSSIYEDAEGTIHALVWNPSKITQTVTFRGPGDVIIQLEIPAQSLAAYPLNN